MLWSGAREPARAATSTVTFSPCDSSACSAAVADATRSAGSSARKIPANFPARWLIRLSSQLPPCSAITFATNSTNPGRSGPNKVSTRSVMGERILRSRPGD